MDTYDVIVIGGGPAGENVVERCRADGLTVAVVEQELLGGECSYWACIPSKALLRPGEVLAAVARVPGAREAVTGSVDAKVALARRDDIVGDWDDTGQEQWLDGAGGVLVRGHGRLAGSRRVDVSRPDGSTVELEARRAVVLATGSVAAIPPIPGLADAQPWGSRGATSARAVPERLAVLGGGVVGVEMGQAFHRLGSRTTILEAGPRLLANGEPEAGDELARAFADEGIDVLTETKVTGVERAGKGAPVTVHLDDDRTVEADELLVATGRRPSTADLGLETVGLEPGKYVEVDDRLRATGVDGDWLYAIGDVNGRALLTHMGKYQARVVADVIRGRDGITAWADHRVVPSVVFTDPQVGSVGLTEARAREEGIDVRTVEFALGGVAAAATHGEGITGVTKLVVDEQRRIVVGATFVGPDVAELVHSATIAIAGEVPLDTLWHAVPAFPTLAEVWLRLLEAYGL